MSDTEWKRLADHNPQPGDVVEWEGRYFTCFQKPEPTYADSVWAGTEGNNGWIGGEYIVRVVSRANRKAEPDYNNGEWWGWNGGECPLHPETEIEVRWMCGYARKKGRVGQFSGSGQWTWDDEYSNRIVAFRVLKPHTTQEQPREVWIVDGAHVYTDKEKALQDMEDFASSDIAKYRRVED